MAKEIESSYKILLSSHDHVSGNQEFYFVFNALISLPKLVVHLFSKL